MLEITRQNKRGTGCIRAYSPENFVGRGMGSQHWGLHPDVRGSSPLRSSRYHIKFLGGLQ